MPYTARRARHARELSRLRRRQGRAITNDSVTGIYKVLPFLLVCDGRNARLTFPYTNEPIPCIFFKATVKWTQRDRWILLLQSCSTLFCCCFAKVTCSDCH